MKLGEKVLNIAYILLTLGILYFGILVGAASEEHLLCLNGAVEHCIPEDFE